MPHRNRVTPYGDIIRSPLRGQWMGNRGCIHEGFAIVRPWNGKRWIVCALEYKGWVAPKWEPRRWTPLFFHDEAVALAAGHRPCALCRHADYRRFREAFGGGRADEIDARLHVERVDGRAKRLHADGWDLPIGTFVDLAGGPALVTAAGLRPWSPVDGYRGPAVERPSSGTATVITPAATVAALRAGYPVHIAA